MPLPELLVPLDPLVLPEPVRLVLRELEPLALLVRVRVPGQPEQPRPEQPPPLR